MWLNIFRIILVLCLFSALACERKQELAYSEVSLEDIPDREGWNGILTTSKNGITSSRIHYTYMQQFSKKKLVRFPEAIEIELFDSVGALTSNVTADSAEWHESERKLDMVKNVVARSHDGLRLSSQKLSWNDYDGRIYTDAFVTVITAQGDTINGVGFESDKFFKNWTIKKSWGVTQKQLQLDVMNSDDAKSEGKN